MPHFPSAPMPRSTDSKIKFLFIGLCERSVISFVLIINLTLSSFLTGCTTKTIRTERYYIATQLRVGDFVNIKLLDGTNIKGQVLELPEVGDNYYRNIKIYSKECGELELKVSNVSRIEVKKFNRSIITETVSFCVGAMGVVILIAILSLNILGGMKG